MKEKHEQTEAEVVRSRPLTPSIHCLSVERPAEFRFQSGQYAMVQIETPAGLDDRFLSMASALTDEHLDFAVRLSESEFKQAFRRLREGDRVRLVGPSGRFVRDRERPAVLLSGGIGVTPLRSMLREAAERGDLPPTVLVFGNRNPREIPFRDELDRLAERGSVRVIHTVDEADDSWPGAVGRIGPELIETAVRGLPPSPAYYVCGPPAMVEAMSGLLAGLGIDENDVLNEHFTGY